MWTCQVRERAFVPRHIVCVVGVELDERACDAVIDALRTARALRALVLRGAKPSTDIFDRLGFAVSSEWPCCCVLPEGLCAVEWLSVCVGRE